MSESTKKLPNKPDWLHFVESQSWQAELIASGLAIYGSLALGPIIKDGLQILALHVPYDYLSLVSFLSLYIIMAHSVLVFSFISHLVLRIVWAGFVGLSSVYPEGISTDKKSGYSKLFLDRLKQNYPKLSDYCLKLDNQCSVIFSLLCTTLFILFASMIWISLFSILNYLLVDYIPDSAMNVLIFLFYGFVLFAMFLAVGPYKHKSFASRITYLVNVKSSNFLLLGFGNMFNYLFWTLRTNVSFGGSMVKIFTFTVLISFYSIFAFNDIISIFDDPENLEYGIVQTSNRYLDSHKNTVILNPVIQSSSITDAIVLFVPQRSRDHHYLNESYEALTGFSYEQLSVNKKMDALDSYFNITIDDKDYNSEWLSIRHSHNNEKGYQMFLDVKDLDNGFHEISIEANRYCENYNVFEIPFTKF